MIGKQVSFARRLAMAAVLATVIPAALAAQNHPVTGRVTTSQLQPISGASVMVQGTTTGTLTNANGTYSLVAPNPGATLVVSSLGQITQNIAIEGRGVVNVTMEAQAIALDELVVVGYGQQTRASVSGAVSSISSEDVTRSSQTTTAGMLAGKMAGINTRMTTTGNGTTGREPTDGRPGSAATIQIRNMGEPLFIIDGVPVTALEFNQINPADVENVSVLKDASASVYGFRAANGVVLVTTKKGTAFTTPRVQVDGYYGWQTLPRNRYPSGFGDTSFQRKYAIVESQQNLGQNRTISAAELENWRVGGEAFPDYEMWNFFVQPNAPQAQINANVSGGTEASRYYLSLGHVTQDYAMRDNNFTRTNLQSNLSSELFRGLTVGTEIRGRVENHSLVAITDAGDDILLHMLRAVSSAWPWENPYANGNPDYINGEGHYFIRSPVAFTRDNSGTKEQVRTNFTGNFWAEYLLPFNATARATYSQTKDLEEYDVHRYTFNGYCYDADANSYDVCQTYGGQVRQSIRAVGDQQFGNVTLSHSGALGAHSLSSVAGLEINGSERTTTDLTSVPPTNFNPLIDFVNVQDAGTQWTINRRSSYFGRLNYDYNQKYLLELLGRYDGSYLYAPGKRWGFFPGVSVGWRMTEEPWVQDALPFVNELKLRASWGQAGREQGINNWGFLGGATYGQGSAVMDGTVITGVAPRGLPVTNLSWVTSTSRNAGIDLVLLDGRLSGEFDIFERRLTGLPAARNDVSLPLELGYTLPNENLESEANVGFDAMVTYSDAFGSIAYSFAPNITIARTKILERYNPRYSNSWLEYRNAQENRWDIPNNSWSYSTIGQFTSMEEIARHPVDIDGQGNRSLLPGDLIFEDVNGNGMIDALDQRPLGRGTGTPIISYGLSGSLSYAGLSLNYDLSGGTGYSWIPSNLVYVPYQTDYNGFTSLSSRWRRADPYDNNSEWIPGKHPPLRMAQTAHSSYRSSDFSRINISYLRLTRLELGFRIPPDLGEHLGFTNMRFFSSISNPLIYDNTRKFATDPEIANTSGFQYPYTIVKNVGFSASLGGQPTAPAPVVPVPPSDDD